MTGSGRGMEEYRKIFGFNDNSIKARIGLILGRNYSGDLRELWCETLAYEDFIFKNYMPLNLGFLFSRNALIPSTWSSEAKHSEKEIISISSPLPIP